MRSTDLAAVLGGRSFLVWMDSSRGRQASGNCVGSYVDACASASGVSFEPACRKQSA